MRIARTLEARVAALEGVSASDDVAIDWDLSGLSETDLERLREAVSVFRADGAWKRIDGGEKLVAGTVTIECRQETGKCVEASTMISDGFVYAPELVWFDAEFAPDAVSYVNDVPNCVRYAVRLDLKMEKVIAVRDKKPSPTDARCSNMEQRIEMQLGDGYEPGKPALDGHIVPLFSLIAAMAKLF
jgi:hypothetical protein